MYRFVLLSILIAWSGCRTLNYTQPDDDGSYWPIHNYASHHDNPTRLKAAAIIVAVEDYVFLPSVAGADVTATEWSRFLRTNRGINDVTIISGTDATRERILEVAAHLKDKDVDQVWFIFVGHGAPDAQKNQGLLVGVDAQQTPGSLLARAVSREELLLAMGQKTPNVVMVLDACFSGRASDGSGLANGIQPVIPMRLSKLPSNVTVLSAARSDQFARQLTGTARPAFSYLLQDKAVKIIRVE